MIFYYIVNFNGFLLIENNTETYLHTIARMKRL